MDPPLPPEAGQRGAAGSFPHAGGSASYYFPLSAGLPGHVDMLAVQYPGRQERRAEPLVESVAELSGLVPLLQRRGSFKTACGALLRQRMRG
ncbi:thioesterase domain-containing protein [Saccharopolyspora sp. NPDC000359]|uniref:thioesterase II family protein n=1 Tax=Saccharopolyspora sp. NPDC000359 TaxID=3154251 RepID=UPI0033166688